MLQQDIMDSTELNTVQDIYACTVVFDIDDEFHASLGIIGQGSRELVVTILHECANGALVSYDITGNATLLCLAVSDGESLSVFVRHDGRLVGTAFLEVNIALAEVVPALLVPRMLSNIIIYQRVVDDVRAAEELEKVEVAR